MDTVKFFKITNNRTNEYELSFSKLVILFVKSKV